MTVEIYQGRDFSYGHERKALGEFVQDFIDRYGDSETPFIIISEIAVNNAAIDLLLLSPQGIILADFKNLTKASPADHERIHLRGCQNGSWAYLLPDGTVCTLGGHGPKKNPFEQLQRHRHELAGWMATHSQAICGAVLPKPRCLESIYGWVVIAPGFDSRTNNLDLPWDDIRDNGGWFQVLSHNQLAWQFNTVSNPRVCLTIPQMRDLIKQLGATRCSLENILPEMPARRLPFFSPPHVARAMVDREAEKQRLAECLANPSVSVICLTGLAGVGKTALGAWVAAQAPSKKMVTRWLDCAEKDVTDEAFLAAVAAEMESRSTARLITDRSVPMLDRIDSALGFLSRHPALLVLDDFHRVPQQKGLDVLLTYCVQHCDRLKILLISQKRPACLDDPAWPPGAGVEIILHGLPRESIADFFLLDNAGEISESQIEHVWQRTSGFPYMLKIFIATLRKLGWEEAAGYPALHHAAPGEAKFESLKDMLSPDAWQFACTLSACRTPIRRELAHFVWHNPGEADALLRECCGQNILEEDGSGGWAQHDFIREFLYEQLPDGRKKKVHQDLGRHFAHTAAGTQNPISRAAALAEAMHHFERAGSWAEILTQAVETHKLLEALGNWDVSQRVAQQAVRAAATLNDLPASAGWLLNVAGRELEQDRLSEAGHHIHAASDALLQVMKRYPKAGQEQAASLQTRILQMRGRMAYQTSDFDQAQSFYEQALKAARENGMTSLQIESLVSIGRIERQRGLFQQARVRFEEAGTLAANVNDLPQELECIAHIGLIARQEGDYNMAADHFQEAERRAADAGDLRGREKYLSLLADLELRWGFYPEAEKRFRDCIRTSQEIGSGIGLRINRSALAETLVMQHRLEEAASLLAEVETACKAVQDNLGMAWVFKRKGQLQRTRGHEEEGKTLISKGIELLREIGSEVYVPDFERALAPVQPSLPGV